MVALHFCHWLVASSTVLFAKWEILSMSENPDTSDSEFQLGEHFFLIISMNNMQ